MKEIEPKLSYNVAISDFQTAIKLAEWGTYGIDGKQPLKYVRLVDCATSHLEKIILQTGLDSDYGKIITQILKDRK